MIAVVDYKKGNLKSVERGLIAAGGDARITQSSADIAQAEAIVLPGVGAFADAAASMTELKVMDVIFKQVKAGVPFLGICLGLHLMFTQGMEGASKDEQHDNSDTNGVSAGIGLISGCVRRMPQKDSSGKTYKVPHVGWNSLYFADNSSEGIFARGCPLLEGIASGEYFYFTHSYIAPDSAASVAFTQHSVTFPSVVQVGNCAFGVQFHPEKSSDAGMRVLQNFVNLVKGM